MMYFQFLRPKTWRPKKTSEKKRVKIIKNCNAEPCRLLDRAGWLKWLK